MTLKYTGNSTKKRLFKWISILCFSISTQALAQETSADTARKMLWDAAKAIEEGHLDTARSQLDRALKIDNPPQDITALIAHLQQAITEQEGSDSTHNELTSALEKAANSRKATLDKQELKAYLDHVSKAIDLLVIPSK